MTRVQERSPGVTRDPVKATRDPVEANRRPTRQRAAVAAVLVQTGEFRSAQELHALLREAGDKVGLATVYRNLVCRDCRRTVEVEGPTVEAWATKVSAEHGFTEVHHTLEIFGTCADCAR